jgi:pyruvate dehydrogenase E2 component (dihydrolipoamide acetyltransferase)
LATTVSMPQLGETVTEGTILRWAKQVGDTISEDEVLVEISTDKVDTEVPSPVSGTILEILVEEGDTVEVGTEMVRIGEEGEEAEEEEKVEAEAAPADAEEEAPEEEEEPEEEEPAAEEEEPEKEPEEEPEEEPEPDEDFEMHPGSETPTGPDTGFEAGEKAERAEPSADRVEQFFAEPHPGAPRGQLLSPVVRKLVREHEVDLSEIEGSGAGGRITRKDVEAHLEKAPAEKPATKAEPPKEPAKKEEAPKEPAKEPAEKAAAVPGEEVDLDRIRVRIAENMAKAKSTAAHVWTSVEVDYERLERVRQSHKEEFKKNEGFSLTYLPFIARATLDALKAYPVVNSSLDLENKKATYHKKVDLGIAIDLDQGGLVVARVRNADGLRMVGIAREIRELAERARAGKLDLDDLTGSTFTITNPGPFGSFMSAPIINVPNVAILSTETITKRPTVVTTPDGQDTIAIRHIGYLGFSWDHRAFDGSTAVLFLKRVKENIETWDWNQELA